MTVYDSDYDCVGMGIVGFPQNIREYHVDGNICCAASHCNESRCCGG